MSERIDVDKLAMGLIKKTRDGKIEWAEHTGYYNTTISGTEINVARAGGAVQIRTEDDSQSYLMSNTLFTDLLSIARDQARGTLVSVRSELLEDTISVVEKL